MNEIAEMYDIAEKRCKYGKLKSPYTDRKGVKHICKKKKKGRKR